MAVDDTFELTIKETKPACVLAAGSTPRSFTSSVSTGLALSPRLNPTGVLNANHCVSLNPGAVHVNPRVPFEGTSTRAVAPVETSWVMVVGRSEEHTSELQSLRHL